MRPFPPLCPQDAAEHGFPGPPDEVSPWQTWGWEGWGSCGACLVGGEPRWRCLITGAQVRPRVTHGLKVRRYLMPIWMAFCEQAMVASWSRAM